jgi:hypothetical protein
MRQIRGVERKIFEPYFLYGEEIFREHNKVDGVFLGII